MAPSDTAGRGKTSGEDAEPIREIFSAVGDAAREKARELADISRAKIDQIKKKSVEDLYHDARTYVRENPGKTLLGALAAGFILGRLFRRR